MPKSPTIISSSRDTEMGKIYLHVFLPLTALFILNNLVLMTLDTPGYLLINLVSFGVVVSFSLIALSFLKLKENEKDKSIEILDDAKDPEVLDEVYRDLKKLLIANCHKESLPVAKELAKICTKLEPHTTQAPKESPFRQGSLRSAFRIAS